LELLNTTLAITMKLKTSLEMYASYGVFTLILFLALVRWGAKTPSYILIMLLAMLIAFIVSSIIVIANLVVLFLLKRVSGGSAVSSHC
jgi:hypothetical protein